MLLENQLAPKSQKVFFFQIGTWALAAIVSIIAIVAWGGHRGYTLSGVNGFQLFPLLGLLAFSIMWSHYINSTIGELIGVNRKVLKRYYQYTGYAVLVLICLHPGILIYSLFRNGVGLPPGSYEHYVGPGLGWVALLGTVSFFVFIAFEFRRVFADRSWWHFVTEAGDLAMLAILYHGFRLGGNLQQGWFRFVWLFYFVTLVAVLLRSYYKKYVVAPSKT
ncbi:MAG: hypothetical protein JWO35_684 [Candidatus Saccharibacteria bacterium]|nr:hypothetical protein [Candidatus Saccharibacteria bacterium]